MKLSIFAAALAVCVATPGNAAVNVTVYTDSAAFAAAVGSVATENFADTALVPGLSFVSTVGYIGGGLFNDRPVSGGAETTFSFAGGTNGFGGLFDLSPGGFGQGLEFTLNLTGGGTEVAGHLLNSVGSFYGFTSVNRFDSVTWRGYDSASGSAETFSLDNAQFGFSGAVPEPAAWTMLIMGFGLVGAGLRSRRSIAATA